MYTVMCKLGHRTEDRRHMQHTGSDRIPIFTLFLFRNSFHRPTAQVVEPMFAPRRHRVHRFILMYNGDINSFIDSYLPSIV